MKTMMIAAAALAAVASAGNAQTFASAPLFGGSGQTSMACYLYNAGSKIVTLSGLAVRDEHGALVGGTTTSCGATLLPHRSCAIGGNIGSFIAYLCTSTATPKAGMRGTFDIRLVSGGVATVLRTQALR